jgi:hypothetical protein
VGSAGFFRRASLLTANSTSSSPAPSRRIRLNWVVDFARVIQWRSIPVVMSGTSTLACT